MNEPAAVVLGRTPATGRSFGALLTGARDETLVSLPLPSRGERPHIDRAQSTTDTKLLRFGHEPLNKRVVDLLVYVEAFGRRANLAAI